MGAKKLTPGQAQALVRELLGRTENKSDTLFVRFFHGRRSPLEELDDWGTDGPMIGPVGVATTYGHLKLFDAGWNDFEHVCAFEDLFLVGGVFYGDMEIFAPGDSKLVGNLQTEQVLDHAEFRELRKSDEKLLEKLVPLWKRWKETDLTADREAVEALLKT